MNDPAPARATSSVDLVLLAAPRGFCAGVEMAIKALTWMVRAFDGPVYCYHEIVHNQRVVQRFEAQGVVFVDDVAELPQAIADHARAGDVVVSMGAGSIGQVPAQVLELKQAEAAR